MKGRKTNEDTSNVFSAESGKTAALAKVIA